MSIIKHYIYQNHCPFTQTNVEINVELEQLELLDSDNEYVITEYDCSLSEKSPCGYEPSQCPLYAEIIKKINRL